MRRIDLWRARGDFAPNKPHWGAQARLQTKLLQFCSQKFDREPSATQLKEHLRTLLSDWRNAGE
jgi:hypothetical protein